MVILDSYFKFLVECKIMDFLFRELIGEWYFIYLAKRLC